MALKGARTQARRGFVALVEMLTGRIGKITGLIAVVVTLLAGIAQLLGGAHEISRMWSAYFDVPAKECFKAELDVRPAEVSVTRWNSVQFHLKGPNECRATLAVHVAFKAQSGAVRIEPPFRGPDQPACSGYENPECWEVKSLDVGKDVDWLLTPPRLTRLGPLSTPVKVAINWIVYNTETRKRVRAGKAEIIVKEDGGA